MDKTLSQLETKLKRLERDRAASATRERRHARRARERAEGRDRALRAAGITPSTGLFIFDPLSHALGYQNPHHPLVVTHARQVLAMLVECGGLALARPGERLWPLAQVLLGDGDGDGGDGGEARGAPLDADADAARREQAG